MLIFAYCWFFSQDQEYTHVFLFPIERRFTDMFYQVFIETIEILLKTTVLFPLTFNKIESIYFNGSHHFVIFFVQSIRKWEHDYNGQRQLKNRFIKKQVV